MNLMEFGRLFARNPFIDRSVELIFLLSMMHDLSIYLSIYLVDIICQQIPARIKGTTWLSNLTALQGAS